MLAVGASWDRIETALRRALRGTPVPVVTGPSEFYCPMHPSVVQDAAGKCPQCSMPLAERARSSVRALPAGTLARIQLSPRRIAQAGIATSEVRRLPLEARIDFSCTLEPDERRRFKVCARVPGRIERLFVQLPGTSVGVGDPLAWVLNRKVAMMLDELRAAESELNTCQYSSYPIPPARMQAAKDAVAAARAKLQAEGALPDPASVARHDMEHSRGRPPEPLMHVEETAPVAGIVTKKLVVQGDYVPEGGELYEVCDTTRLWAEGRVSVEDAQTIALGPVARVTCDQSPGEEVEAYVSFVDPLVDPATRTARVVLDLPNFTGKLWPGGFARARVSEPLAGVEPTQDAPTCWSCALGHRAFVSHAPGTCPQCAQPLKPSRVKSILAVPASAVIDLGSRRLVYRESGPGVFDAIAVELGRRAGDAWEVKSGLEEGERVASSGAFLIDAETRLDPGAASAYFGASASPAREGR